MKPQRPSVGALALTLVLILGGLAGQVSLKTQGTTSSHENSSNVQSQQKYGELPLSFVPNVGQTEAAVRFQVNSLGGTLFFTSGEVVLALPQGKKNVQSEIGEQRIAMTEQDDQMESAPLVVKMQLIGAAAEAEIAGTDALPGVVNYFIGNDPKQWHADIPTYAGIAYQDVYPGIDLHYDGREGRLKGTYTVAAGVDPSAIQWRYEGNTGLSIDAQTGDLLIALSNGNVLREAAPTAWQEKVGAREPIETRYALDGETVRFEIGTYDARLPLVIDPTFEYATYLGGDGADSSGGIAVDSSGNAYITGSTLSDTFPTQSPYQSINHGNGDAYVAKLNATGNVLIYSTYFGGNGEDDSYSIAVDSSGNAYITGGTDSSDFPTQNPYQSIHKGNGDVFVTKLNAAGNALVYSTYIGAIGVDEAWDIALDSSNNAYLTGWTNSPNYPTLNPFQTANPAPLDIDVIVTKLNANGNALLYSTYLGGNGGDMGYAIAVDSSGSAYITGSTESTGFPTMNPFQAIKGAGDEIFVTKFSAAGNGLVYSTYLGGSSSDVTADIAVDSGGNAYIVGGTTSTNFPTQNPFQAVQAGSRDIFLTKFSTAGNTLVFSTYLGGFGYENSTAIALDNSGSMYITGVSSGADYPVLNAIQSANAGGNDVIVTKMNALGSALLYSTYLGGTGSEGGVAIALDNAGGAYIAGSTNSTDFPVKNPRQAVKGSANDAIVFKINDATPPTSTPTFTRTATTTHTLTPIPSATNTPTQTGTSSTTPSATATVVTPVCSNVVLMLAALDPTEDNMFRLTFDNQNASSGILTAVALRWIPNPMSPFMYPNNMILGANQSDPEHWSLAATGLPPTTTGSLDFNSAMIGWTSTGDRTVVPLNATSTWRVQMANMNGTISDNLSVFDFVGTDLTIEFPDSSTVCHVTVSGIATSTARPSKTPTPSTTPLISSTPTLTATATSTEQATLTVTASITPSHTSTASITPSATHSPTASSTATATMSATATSTVIAGHQDTIGIFRASVSTFYLRNSNTTGFADSQITFGGAGYLPIVGDWNGDGIDTPGVYKSSTGQFYLTNSTANPAVLSYSFVLGSPGDQPIVGDWDGDGRDGVGVFRPSNGLIYLKNSLSTGFADFTMVLGSPGDVGIAGDWNGDGKDSPGVYRPSNQVFYLSNATCNCSVFADAELGLGIAGDTPFVGDWDGDGKSGVGVYRQSNGLTYIKNALTTGFADSSFVFGSANDYPLAGYWVRVAAPSSGEPAPTFIP